MRAIIEYAVRHRVTMLMVALAAVLFGFVSLDRLPVQLLPSITYPTLTLQTEYSDSAPHEVESLITRPLEEGAGVVPGLRRISSVSRAGVSEITMEFGWDTDMDFAALDIREKVDLVTLPDRAKAPVLLRYDPSLDPIVRLGLHGIDNPVMLRYLAEQLVKKELESVKGIAAAKVLGGLQEEVHVDVDEDRLAALGIPISMVTQILQQENVNAAGGRLRDRDSQFLVRTLNQFHSPEDVGETIITRVHGRVVKLSDVAKVTRRYKEREIVSRINGAGAVEIAIYKEGDANLVEVADRARSALKSLEKELPEGVQLTILSDQSTFIQRAVSQVQNNALLGGLLAVIILFVFLRDVRSTTIIALAIPTSIITTFILMYRQGITLNVMSLGGLALGVGMLVDNSIVVLESIVRHVRLRGSKTRQEAVIEGTEEVASAVSASTLTTIAVFLPILFVEGVARQIFEDQALTVTYALLVSLVVSLTLTPMVAALGGSKKDKDTNKPAEKPKENMGRFMTGMQSVYVGVLSSALKHRWAVILPAIVLLGLSVLGLRTLGSDLIPPLSQGEFKFAMEFQEGTPIEHTNVVMAKIETDIASIPGVGTVFSNVGLDARRGGSLRSKRENRAELNIKLDRGALEESVIQAIREKLAQYPNVDATLRKPTYFTFKNPISVEIYGYNLEALKRVAEEVALSLEDIDGLKDVTQSIQPGSPEVQIQFDRDRLKAAGLDLGSTGRMLRTAIMGDIATDYKERDRQIDIRVRAADARDMQLSDLPAVVVGYHEGTPVHLSAVANIALDRGPAEITRISQTRAVSVTANLAGRDLGSVSAEIESRLRDIPLPAEVTVELGGQNAEMQDSMRSLIFAVLMAIFMVYLVMASQFESLLNPFLILLAVPLALVGVVIALILTHTPVSVVVMIGAIMLAGIVVNNGIVLVDLIGRLNRTGHSVRDAIIEGGSIRLRPILMTSATTVLALIPMALGRGEGGELGSPLAVTVIGGLLVSTILTLVVIPVLYSLTHRDHAHEVQ